ncbi:hypothetical protein evm_003030 [Chilo suppressalis]|nr:hypothetical protein evm_003030 [Chilo suppressalis]
MQVVYDWLGLGWVTAIINNMQVVDDWLGLGWVTAIFNNMQVVYDWFGLGWVTAIINNMQVVYDWTLTLAKLLQVDLKVITPFLKPTVLSQMQIMNNTSSEKHNKRYRRKYKFVKIRIRGLLLENAALCDEVAKIQESILIVKEERKFLLRKLLEYENDPDVSLSCQQNDFYCSNGSRGKTKKRTCMED